MVRVNVVGVEFDVDCGVVGRALSNEGVEVWVDEWFTWVVYEGGELLACAVLGDGDDIECTDITWLIKKCRGD